MSLHDELQWLADTALRPSIDHTVWDRGRSLRRRDRLVTSAVVLVMVLIVGALGSLVLGPPRVVAPGWGADSVLATSPSGDRLAWLSDGAIGLSVVTLRTGEIQGTSIVQDAGSRPSAVAWSPDGAVVAWLSESPSNSLYGTHVTAGIRPTRPTTKGVSSGRSGLVGVAVADDRTVAVGTRQGDLLLGTGGDTQKVAGRLDGFPANFSPDGTALALENRMIPSPVSSTLEVSTGKQWRHPFPADTLGPATTRPLGWLDDRLQLILAQESFDEDAEFVITTPKVSGTSTWRRSVGFVDPAVVSSLSVAVDLMPNLDGTSSQQFTHDFGEPDWVSQRDISWIIGLGVAGALSVLYGLRWLWRRRTSL